MVGRTLAQYIVLDRIGAGGMGVVYRARDTQLERVVALKVVGDRDQLDPGSQARLMREARTASVLSHPHICTIYGAGQVDGITYIAMELVEGRTLNSIVIEQRLVTADVVRYGIQLADALEHAHERGVVHRDLKCANIVITPAQLVKILDFGLAKRERADVTRSLETITETGAVMGTLNYMAPETLNGNPADARTDLWAVGVILYRTLTGSLPFTGATAFQVSSQIQRDEPPPLPTDIPKRLADVVQKLLSKDPAHRYQGAGELRSALEELRAELFSTPVSPGSQRRRIWIGAVASIVLVSTAAALVWHRHSSKAGTPTLTDGYRPSATAQANEYYERALLFGPTGARAEPEQMRRMLERALEADPRFAAARALYAWSLVMVLWGGNSSDAGLLYRAEEEARRALQDDPQCGQAYTDLAVIHMLQGRKELFPGETRRAAESNPHDARVYTWRILYHHINGDYDRAVQQAREVISRAPLQWPPHLYIGEILREQGDLAGSARHVSRILEQEPQNLAAIGVITHARLDAGELAQAREILERTLPGSRKSYRTRPVWALLLALERKRDEATREMDADLERYLGSHVFVGVNAAEFYAVMGDRAKALEWLDRAVRMGDDRDDWFRRNPHLASIRHDPRFEQMLASIAYRRKQRSEAEPN